MSYRLLSPIIEVYAIKTWQIKPALSNEMPEPGFAQNKPPSFNVNIDTFSPQQPYEQPSSFAQPPPFTQPPPYTQPPSYPPPPSNGQPPIAPPSSYVQPPSYPPSYN